jgi:hypothetical protein
MAVEAFVEDVVAHLARRGWARAEVLRRLEETGWRGVLAAVAGTLAPAAVGDDLERHTRCSICGHPLHQAVGDVRLEVDGVRRTARNLPHTAACSCGYAGPLVPEVWLAALRRYFRDHPAEAEVDVAGQAFRRALRADVG